MSAKNFVYCRFCGEEYDRSRGDHPCAPDVLRERLAADEFGRPGEPSEEELSAQIVAVEKYHADPTAWRKLPDGTYISQRRFHAARYT